MARLAALLALLALLVAAAPASATYPGRNGPIAYVQDSGSEDPTQPPADSHALLVRPPGGGDARTLFESPIPINSPSYSPNGRLIAFDAGTRIGIVAASGGPVTLLPAATADDGDPTWAPGGRLIAFTGINERGRTDILQRRYDGAGAVIPLIYDASEPAYSPTGDLAYVRDGNVYVRWRGGPHRWWVTSGVSPDWSPNGNRLVVVRPRANLVYALPFGRLYTVRRKGGGLRLVAGTSTLAGHPVWSPDGRWIAYDGLDLGVYVKRLGSRRAAREIAPTQFSGSSGYVDSYQPAWRPRRR